jgi:penicillin amidase
MRKLLKALATVIIVLLVVLLLVASGGYVFVRRSFPKTDGTIQIAGLKSRVEVYRDQHGIPHLYADNLEDLFFTQGYVHAQDRLWQMEFNRRIGNGTLSEVLGETTLSTDRFLRTMGLRRAAEADWAALEAETRLALESYAAGVNAFIESHEDRLPLEFTILGFKPAPWTPLDSLVWGKVMAWDLGSNWETELLWAKLVDKLGKEKVQELLPPYPDQAPFIVPPEVKSYAGLGAGILDEYARAKAFLDWGGEGVGSNNWVVDGAKTTTGMPLLANDPHLGLGLPSIWYEMGLHGGGFDVVGASFPGAPCIIIGHNQHIAWGVTNVGPDVQDLYIEKINPTNPHQYQVQGQWEDMEVVQEEIKVKGRDEPVLLEVRLTCHGPIINDVAESLEDSPEALAFRWTALEGGQLFQSVYMLNQARNWEEFRAALRYWGVPAQNFVYADVEGNIGYQMPGNIPIRANGQGLVPVPGWTEEYEWTGYIPFDELPSAYNPATRFIVTANNKVVPDDYPYFISYEWSAPYRAQRVVHLLTAKDKLSVQDFGQIQADTYSIPGEKLVPYLLASEPQGTLEEQAMEHLRAWDFRAEADSPGAAIFQVFYLKLVENTLADELGEEMFEDYLDRGEFHRMALERLMEQPASPWFDDVSTPEVERRDEIVQRSFKGAIAYLSDRFGDTPSRWTWGRLHTMTFVHNPLGQSGIGPLEKLFNRGPIPARGSGYTVDAASFDDTEPFAMNFGVSYRQIIDLGDWGNSLFIHTTGQSGYPLHRHYADMMAPWQAVEYHPMHFDKASIEADKEGVLVLTP